MNDIHSLSHSKWNCKYHIVFAPKYRRKVFYGTKRFEIGQILRQLCNWYGVLSYATTNRDGYKEFKSKSYICENCKSRNICTENSKYEKTVTKHIWMDYLEQAEDIRHTPKYRLLYEKRKETIERVFADAKEKYSMRYTLYRGLTQVTNWVRLKFATMNLKKYAIHKWKMELHDLILCRFSCVLSLFKMLAPEFHEFRGFFDRLTAA